MSAKLFKAAVIKTLPVMAGYLALGVGFGILLRVNGYGVLWAIGMSITMYAGAMQYIAISLITAGASLLTTAVTTLLVNARHLFYGISLIDRYRGAGLKKLYMMHALTDETYALVCTAECPEGEDPHKYYFLMSVLDHIYWISGCTLGNLLGSLIKFNTAGIDFVMTALFVTLFVDQWLTTKEHRPALIGIGATVICLLIFGSGNFLIPSMAVIIVVLLLSRKALVKGGRRNG